MDINTDGDRVWVRTLNEIILNGRGVNPRGSNTLELIQHTSTVQMSDCIVTVEDRNVGYKFMAAEAAWILSGSDRVEDIAPFSKEISKFSDNGETFFGAYGPKVVDQLWHVIMALAEDPYSRQAVMTIWRENPPKTKDVPCTVALQWIIREDKLICNAFMRSSDAWIGHIYDTFTFSAISFHIILNYERLTGKRLFLGPLNLTCGSKHLYEKDLKKAFEIVEVLENRWPSHELYTPFQAGRYLGSDDPGSLFLDSLWEAANTKNGVLSLCDRAETTRF